MSGRLDIGAHGSGAYASEEVENFLEAAQEFERLHEVEPGLILRQLAQMLRRQAKLQRLRRESDCRRR